MKLEIIGETKEKEIKNAFCSNAFLAAQVLNLRKNQERQVLELKCRFFKRPIKILPKALNINFKDTIAEKLLKDMGKDKKLEDFKETCILEMAGLTYFVCVLPYEYEDKENSEEILKEDFRLLNTKGGLSVRRALINNRHSYEAIELRPIKQELAPGLCLFFQGSLEFNGKTTKTMRTSLLDQIQQDKKSYLKPIVIEWQRIDRVELPTPDPIKKPSINELKSDFNPKRGKSSDLFEWALEQLETLKDLNSPPRFVLERGIEFLEKKLECGGISKIGKDKNNELFYIVETNGKKVFCHSRQCKESANRNELSQGVRVCLEVFLDREDPSKYRGKIYGLEKNREIVLLNTAKNYYQRKPLDEKIKHRIEALKRIKYPCLKIFSHHTLEELETLNPEFATPFKEHLRRLEEYYFDPQTDKDFKKEILDFFGRLNDSIPAKLQQEFINLPFELPSTDFLSRCLGSLEKDFQKTIFKNLKVNPKALSIVARASWINEKFLKNLMAQTDLEQQKAWGVLSAFILPMNISSK